MLKQYPKNTDSIALKNELFFQECLFAQSSGRASPGSPAKNVTFSITPRNLGGLDYIAKLLSSTEDQNDTWLCYEYRGATNLASSLFSVRQKIEAPTQGHKDYGNEVDETIEIRHSTFYQALLDDKTTLPNFIFKMAKALDLL